MSKEFTVEQARENVYKYNLHMARIDYDTKEALKNIEKDSLSGETSTKLFYDEKVRNNLILLGWTVSDKLLEDRFYKTEYMTVSW